MAQAIAGRRREGQGSSSWWPAIYLSLFGVLAVVADLAVGSGVWFFAVAAACVLAMVVSRPHIGIAVLMSAFMIEYPKALQGTGFLTINNVLGLVFLVLLAQRVYMTEDWWFLKSREVRLLFVIGLCYVVSSYLNGPEPRLLELIGASGGGSETRLYFNRVAFVIFFANFIRTSGHIRLIYALAISFMVASAVLGVWEVLHGGGAYGYRATTDQALIRQAWNPNRLALFAIIAIGALWYALMNVYHVFLRAGIVTILLVLILGVFMTASRSGLVGLLACGAYVGFEQGLSLRKAFGMMLVGALALILVLQLVPEKSLERIGNLPGSGSASSDVGTGSLQRRQYGFAIGFEIMKENILLGVGAGNWDITRFLHDPTGSTAAPHSSYIRATAEGGIFCLLAFLGLFWGTWRNFGIAEQLLPAGRLRDLSWVVKGAQVGLITLVIFSLFADLWQSIVLFWLVGLGIVLRRYAENLNPVAA